LSSELEVARQFDQMNEVVEELLKGKNPTQIAKDLNITRASVLNHADRWRELVSGDTRVRERAKEALAGADQHYSMIIQRAWETVEQADANQQFGTKATTLKMIADVESKRIDMLQKAGLLENNELSSQLLETERKQELLVGILKEVTADCPKCRLEVTNRLSEVTGKVEPLD
jgi:hypothetical protein